jgi:hypothetical protein
VTDVVAQIGLVSLLAIGALMAVVVLSETSVPTTAPGSAARSPSAAPGQTGITVIASLREPHPITGAQPSDTVSSGDTLVTVGKAGDYANFWRLIGTGESDPGFSRT